MAITVKDVEHVAALARLDLTEDEKVKFTEQLNAVFDYVEKLNKLNTDEVEPTSHVLTLTNVMREDRVGPSWPLDKLLKNAPDEEDGQFRVPAVLE